MLPSGLAAKALVMGEEHLGYQGMNRKVDRADNELKYSRESIAKRNEWA